MAWLSPKQVAQQLGFSVEHVRREARAGKWVTLRPPADGTGAVRILVDDLGRPVAASDPQRIKRSSEDHPATKPRRPRRR